MKLFYGHSSATYSTLVDKFAGDTERSHMQKTAQNVCKGVSVASGLHKGHGVVPQRRFSDWIYLCLEEGVDGFNLVDWTSTLS